MRASSLVRRRELLALSAALPLLSRARVRAQDQLLGWTEAPPRVASDHVLAVAIGAAHDDDGPLAAARLAARRRGSARATSQIQRWADDALAALGAGPREAQSVLDAIARASSISRVRARADGSAIVEVRCPLSALRSALDHPRLPWHEGAS